MSAQTTRVPEGTYAGLGTFFCGVLGGLSGVILALAWITSHPHEHLSTAGMLFVVTAAGYVPALLGAACYAVIVILFVMLEDRGR